MDNFYLISYASLSLLALACFWFPFLSGKKWTGIVVGVSIMTLLITDAIMDWDFESVVLFLSIVIFGIVYLSYWIPRAFGHIKVGVLLSSMLFLTVGLLIASPWINDWLFTGEDAREILRIHGYNLQDEIKVVYNKQGGFPDLHHMFEVELSERDFNRLKDELKKHPSFLGEIREEFPAISAEQPFLPADYVHENQYAVIRQYSNDSLMNDGTVEFTIELIKEGKRLKYSGFEY